MNAGKFYTAVNSTTIVQQHKWLRQHHVLPPDLELSGLAREGKSQVDLTPFLLQAWTLSCRESKSRQQRRAAERMVAWLETQVERHAELTWGIPGNTHQCLLDWVGHRLVWWPRGIPQGQRIGVAFWNAIEPGSRHCGSCASTSIPIMRHCSPRARRRPFRFSSVVVSGITCRYYGSSCLVPNSRSRGGFRAART